MITNLSSTTPPWITVTSNKDRSQLPPNRIATTTSPSIPVATANQFSSFSNDNKDEACVDSGATINIVKNEVELNNEVITPNGPYVISATKNIMQAKARDELRLSNLSTKATIAHKMTVVQNLLSLSVRADNNMISILDKSKIIICKEDDVRITLTEPPVITGHRASNGLWKVSIVQQSAPSIDLDTYYHPKIANSVVPTFDHKSLFNMPLTAA